MGKKIIIIASILVGLAAIGTGAFFVVKHISDENHKKDIEMAADCAQAFEVPISSSSSESRYSTSMFNQDAINSVREYQNNRRQKLQECVEKYHVTRQEVIDKIGSENYTAR